MSDEMEEEAPAKSKVPELTQEQLNSFTIRCVVCGKALSEDRARRRKDTCSVEHYEMVKQWRKHLMYSRRCHSCHAPYTLKQREQFREWRRSTGQVQRGAGRPAITREKKLEAALLAAVPALKAPGDWDLAEIAKACESALGYSVDMDAPKDIDTASAGAIIGENPPA